MVLIIRAEEKMLHPPPFYAATAQGLLHLVLFTYSKSSFFDKKARVLSIFIIEVLSVMRYTGFVYEKNTTAITKYR